MKIGDKVKGRNDIAEIKLFGVLPENINKLKGRVLTVSNVEAEPGISVIELEEDGPISLSYNIDLFEYAEYEL
ncbi:MAG: hypothetical protein K0R92_427 [Lachnospiraceae bacterium]|jgi:hypothetical protein|nr:hypothetical protein [Lachnospiraceae bacterium]